MVFEKNATPEMVKIFAQTRQEFVFIQKGTILFRKLADMLCLCLCLVGLVAWLRNFAGL